MTKSQIVAHLSDLPQPMVEDIRIMAAILHGQEPTGVRFSQWVECCNEAIEEKEANRLRGYDIQDAEWAFI